MGYGEMLRTKRLEKDFTLRELAARTDIDVAYLSRVERETCAPPQKQELLDAIHEAIGLTKADSRTMCDQAALDNSAIPGDIAAKFKRSEGIPMLLRTVANKKLSAEQIRKLTEFINEQY